MKILLIILFLGVGCGKAMLSIDSTIGDKSTGDKSKDKALFMSKIKIEKMTTTGIKTDKITGEIVGIKKTDNSIDNRVIINDPKWLFWTGVINSVEGLIPFILTIILMIGFMQITISKMLNMINSIVNNISDSLDLIVVLTSIDSNVDLECLKNIISEIKQNSLSGKCKKKK